ncbi:DUF72 domain-containing protein [Streptomyces sp. NPDC059740]|uniref:DUF72 domain-containing protein n=1 Tax=Streptomyces sp. NPDC059740 TaxID=3346926 RepID=UPI0036551D85
MVLHVGTSGWMYRDWRGVLYPDGVPQRDWLSRYAEEFATVENNNAFYRLPSAQTFADWRRTVPEGFVMAVKASRYLTHMKRLRDPEEPVERLLERAAGLGGRLGPVLLQLPPNMREDAGALDRCLRRFPATVRVAVEPRHETWFVPRVRQVLEERSAALCWADRRARPTTPLWRTAEWGYLRLHEGIATPPPRYGRRSLRTWAERVAATWPGGATVHVYFNNDPGGAAVHDAVAFARAARAAGLAPTRVPALPAG